MKFTSLLVLLYTLAATAFPQQGNDSLSSLNKRFQAFEYEKTIALADSLLLNRGGLSKDNLLEIYRIKGISHFSLLQDLQSAESFINILKIDSSYVLDTAKTSPKIIAFFNKVNNDYHEEMAQEARLREQPDTVIIAKIIYDPEAESRVKNSVIRSLILPGWGHLYSGNSAKGIILTLMGGITLASSVYFIIDSNTKEDEYISASGLEEITAKYDKYNDSYKMKNYSLIAFAAVWLYAQMDLLFFSQDIQKEEPAAHGLELTSSGMKLSFKISF
jgi:hypothetical protein